MPRPGGSGRSNNCLGDCFGRKRARAGRALFAESRNGGLVCIGVAAAIHVDVSQQGGKGVAAKAGQDGAWLDQANMDAAVRQLDALRVGDRLYGRLGR